MEAAALPPDGIENVDLENPADVLRTVSFVTQGLTIACVAISVGMRVYAKLKIFDGGVTWDDVATYIATVLMVGYCITGIYATSYGGGYNQWEVRREDMTGFLKSGYAATIFYMPMAFSVKLALMFITMRVFGGVHKKTLLGFKIFLGLMAVYYTTGLFIKIFTCKPINAYWNQERDKCLDQGAIITADAAISLVSDLVVLFAPLPLTWTLHMPLKRRLRIIGILAAGGVATAFSVYRLVMIVEEGQSSNQTMVFIKVILSGNAEAGIGLICACLPAIHALVSHTTAKLSSYDRHSRSRTGVVAPDAPSGGGILLTQTVRVNRSDKGSSMKQQKESWEGDQDSEKLILGRGKARGV